MEIWNQNSLYLKKKQVLPNGFVLVFIILQIELISGAMSKTLWKAMGKSFVCSKHFINDMRCI